MLLKQSWGGEESALWFTPLSKKVFKFKSNFSVMILIASHICPLRKLHNNIEHRLLLKYKHSLSQSFNISLKKNNCFLNYPT